MKYIFSVIFLLFICVYTIVGKSETVPDFTILQNLAKSFFTTENEWLLNGSSLSVKARNGVFAPLKGIAINKALARKSIKDSERNANIIAGIKFTTVTTSIAVIKVTQLEKKNYLVDVIETTSYGYDNNTPPYEYRGLHQVTFAQIEGNWAITNIKSLDPMSDVRDEKVLRKMKRTSAKSPERNLSIVADMKAAINRNLSVLKTQDQMKMYGQSLAPLNDAKSMRGLVTKGGVLKAGVARPKTKTLLTTKVLKWKDGSGPPYSYSDMVSWALTYAIGTPVDYARDTNDCTNFVSWALWRGGWAEVGSQNYANRTNNSAWYWICSYCVPHHSYTWGGALNWQIFANQSGRGYWLSYMSDLVYADVAQIEIDGYGSTTGPDHTMIVTGRDDSSGVVLLSYHSMDTKNKPLTLILQQNDGPYWAFRT